MITRPLTLNANVPTVKYATVRLNASGAVVGAVASRKIRVLAYSIQVDAAMTVKLQNAGGTDLLEDQVLAANQQVSEGSLVGLFEGATNTALNMTIVAGTGNVSVRVTYQEV